MGHPYPKLEPTAPVRSWEEVAEKLRERGLKLSPQACRSAAEKAIRKMRKRLEEDPRK